MVNAVLRHAYVEVNGVRLHYAAAGRGELILFLHGFPEFWYAWRTQLAEFGRDHLAVAADVRGYNLSAKPSAVESVLPRRAASGAFRPPWWCRSGHLQTVWGPLFRRRYVPVRRERIATDDGDFVDLDWLDGSPGAPLLLVLHGLEGSVRSHYVAGLFEAARTRGWRAVVLNFRSCSGEPNRLPRFYHSGDTGDLDAVVRRLVAREPGLRLGVVGVSLGANVLLKWLGECGAEAPPEVRGAVAISTPFDLGASARLLDRGFRRALYTANFMRTLRRKAVDKALLYPGFVDVAGVRRARTFAQYDRLVTAPLHGFADEVDYWTRASCGPYLDRLARPTLLISARDDPLVPSETLPDPARLPACVRAEFLPGGGHAGFIEGRPWRTTSWAERRAVAFLADLV